MGEDASKCRKLGEILANSLKHISSGILHNAIEDQQKISHIICIGYGKLVGIGGPIAAGIASEQVWTPSEELCSLHIAHLLRTVNMYDTLIL